MEWIADPAAWLGLALAFAGASSQSSRISAPYPNRSLSEPSPGCVESQFTLM